MPKPELGTCKSCGAEIQWARLNDKPHPFDMDPRTDGGYMLMDVASEERIVAVFVPKQRRKASDRLVVSHFSTCPDAGAWRREREGA